MLPQVIRAFSYEPRTSRLTVAFMSGRIAVYDAVPDDVADDFLHAESKDRFFTSRIQAYYRARDVGRRAA
jgi:KTSC domain